MIWDEINPQYVVGINSRSTFENASPLVQIFVYMGDKT